MNAEEARAARLAKIRARRGTPQREAAIDAAAETTGLHIAHREQLVLAQTPSGEGYDRSYLFTLSNGRRGYYDVTSISPDTLDATFTITPFGGATSPKVFSWHRDKPGAYIDGVRVEVRPGDTLWGTAFNQAWTSPE